MWKSIMGMLHAGPFNFEAAKNEGNLPTLHINPYSWSKVKNLYHKSSILLINHFCVYNTILCVFLLVGYIEINLKKFISFHPYI